MPKKITKLSKINRADIETRRNYVKDLMAQGLYNTEIVKVLKTKGIDITEGTIRRDRNAIRRKIAREVEKKPIQKILSEMEIQYEKILRDAWTLYRKTDNDYIKTRALKISQDIIEKKSKILDNLGIIERKINLGLDDSIKVEFVKPEWKDESKNKVRTPHVPA